MAESVGRVTGVAGARGRMPARLPYGLQAFEIVMSVLPRSAITN